MTWKNHHRRGEVLREVIRTADERRDGVLPMDVAGVTETFSDELTLLGSLQLRWHTSLSGRIDQAQSYQAQSYQAQSELGEERVDLEAAVVRAWQETAEALPGIRLVLDHYTASPTSPEMAAVMARATGKEHAMMAVMAGRASYDDDAATRRIGEAISLRARTSYPTVGASRRDHAPTLVERLKAVLAA